MSKTTFSLKTAIAAALLLFVLAPITLAATFTINIFDLKNNLRNGVRVTVEVTAIDANDNVISNPNVTINGTASRRQEIVNGVATIVVTDTNVSAVEVVFSGAGLETTAVQRLRNVNPVTLEVAVPNARFDTWCVPCDCEPPCCFRSRWCGRCWR